MSQAFAGWFEETRLKKIPSNSRQHQTDGLTFRFERHVGKHVGWAGIKFVDFILDVGGISSISWVSRGTDTKLLLNFFGEAYSKEGLLTVNRIESCFLSPDLWALNPSNLSISSLHPRLYTCPTFVFYVRPSLFAAWCWSNPDPGEPAWACEGLLCHHWEATSEVAIPYTASKQDNKI